MNGLFHIFKYVVDFDFLVNLELVLYNKYISLHAILAMMFSLVRLFSVLKKSFGIYFKEVMNEILRKSKLTW